MGKSSARLTASAARLMASAWSYSSPHLSILEAACVEHHLMCHHHYYYQLLALVYYILNSL